MIGTLMPTSPQPQSQPKPQPKPKKTEPESGGRPQNNPPSGEVISQNNPPPQSGPAEQPKPAEPEPQVIVQNPSQKPAQVQDPIIIMPKSVSNGNSSKKNSMPGYSGGDGSGPLIYNP